VILVFALLFILAVVIVWGFPRVDVQRFEPFNPMGFKAVFAVAGMVFVSFGGLTKVTAVSEEAKNPGRNIPLAMFLAFTIISLLYLLVVFVTIGTVAPSALAGSLTPVAMGAQNSMGTFGTVLVTVAAAFAFATTGNAGIMAASRSPMAMSRDGLLPAWFSTTHPTLGTPIRSLMVTSLFIIAVLTFLSVEALVKTASTMMILMFALVNLSVIIMRKSKIEGYRPSFSSPFFPYVQIGAILIYGFLIFEMGIIPVAFTGGFILFALVWYLVYVQQRINNESAFIYLVKKVTNHHFARSHIENELRSISLERDSIEFDRFDHLVKDGLIMDIKEQMGATELFARLARELAIRFEEDEQRLYELFLERERVSSTVIAPGLAIPHIIVEGEHRFEVVLVRALEGVIFSELSKPVHTMFVLIGSMDERNYHLRALMSIAHIFQEEDFEKRWLAARNKEQLRDVILLSSRKRGTGVN
ncbi:amino acid permease, partial [Myxococcota bacterium]|nr:amino acid permease [Myxococcota bacterium]